MTSNLDTIMANSEQSFRDRQGRATSLKDACAAFAVAFAPVDTSLTVANFTTFVGVVTAKNDAVDGLVASYTTNANTRVALVLTVRDVLTQALGYLESNKVWKAQAATARKIVEKFRGTKPPKPKAPPTVPGETPAEEKKRSAGNQAYVELAAHLEKFYGVCVGTPGFAPTAAEITASALSGHLSAFKNLNGGLSALEQQITVAQKTRFDLYFTGEDCLQEKFQAIKKAVKGQFGLGSEEYQTVKVIKW